VRIVHRVCFVASDAVANLVCTVHTYQASSLGLHNMKLMPMIRVPLSRPLAPRYLQTAKAEPSSYNKVPVPLLGYASNSIKLSLTNALKSNKNVQNHSLEIQLQAIRGYRWKFKALISVNQVSLRAINKVTGTSTFVRCQRLKGTGGRDVDL
jgi:hypothetical protein